MRPTRRAAEAFRGLELLEPRQLLSTIAWDGGGGDNDWHNPLNWSGDVLPGPDDDVIVTAPGTPTINITQDVSVRSIVSVEAIHVAGARVTTQTQWKQSAPLTIAGGTVAGAGNFAVASGAVVSGAFTGSGKIQVLPGGTLVLSDISLGREVVNNGTLVWASGDITGLGSIIHNLAGRTFLIQSTGSMLVSAGGNLIRNGGTLAAEVPAGGTATVMFTLNNHTGPAGSAGGVPFGPTPGTVEVRSGTLKFDGPVTQKQGEYLVGGHWHVLSSDAQLLLPGPGLIAVTNATGAQSTIILHGAGASFPQLNTARSIRDLRLSGGRAYTFPHIQFGFDRLTFANPGVTVVQPAVTANELRVEAGTLDILNLTAASAVIAEDATLIVRFIGGAGEVSGPGMLRIVGSFSGSILTGGPMVIAPGGEFEVGGPGLPGEIRLERRIVNYGMIRWDALGTVVLGSELVNRGTLFLNGQGFANTSAGLGPGHAPAFIHNFGNVIRNGFGDFTLRGAGGGVRFINHGTAAIVGGRLNLFGGVFGGGNWHIGSSGETAIGGLQSSLINPLIFLNGILRIATTVALHSAQVYEQGSLLIMPAGRLEFHGQGGPFQMAPLTNQGTIYVAPGASVSLPALTNQGDVILGGTLYTTGFAGATGSKLRILSTGPGSHGSLWASSFTRGGSLWIDFSWAAPAGTQFDIYSSSSVQGAFNTILQTGLEPGRGIHFDTWSYRFTNFGRITVV
jgi:hypothetical protein